MVEIAPFRALEYNPEKAPLAQVVAPPFDVIGPDLLKQLRASSPYNITNLTVLNSSKAKGRKKKTDPFKEIDERLQAWTQDSILKPTTQEVLYAYECQYQHRGVLKRMRGVIGRLRLDETYQSVVPHEQIFPKPTEERMKLLKATHTDIEPIQLLYSGKSAEEAMWAYVDGSQRPPDLFATGPDGALHRYWRITDVAVIGTVSGGFKGRKAYIADGHHRYSAAVKYAEQRRTREYRPPKNAPWEYKLCLFVNMADPGLMILPTHRVVKKAKLRDPAKIIEAWTHRFVVEPVPLEAGRNPLTQLQEIIAKSPREHVLGAWFGDETRGHLLVARDPILPAESLPGKSLTYRGLDVVYLQQVAIEKGLGIPESKWGDDVSYLRDDEEAVAAMRKKGTIVVLTHRPSRMLQLRAICDAGERMPPKATYFVPKTLSGVALYPIGKPGPVVKPRITS